MIANAVFPPAVPMMSADWLLLRLFVTTVKLALVAPAGTVTLAGTFAAAVLSLDSATSKPPAGAAAVNVTVPVDDAPPTTSVGLTLTDESDAVVLGGGELTEQPERVTVVAVAEPSLTAIRQSDGLANGSRSTRKLPEESLVPSATPLTVIVRFGEAVPSTRSLLPESSARLTVTAATADGTATTSIAPNTKS
jgi:hypothetical protein